MLLAHSMWTACASEYLLLDPLVNTKLLKEKPWYMKRFCEYETLLWVFLISQPNLVKPFAVKKTKFSSYEAVDWNMYILYFVINSYRDLKILWINHCLLDTHLYWFLRDVFEYHALFTKGNFRIGDQNINA